MPLVLWLWEMKDPRSSSGWEMLSWRMSEETAAEWAKANGAELRKVEGSREERSPSNAAEKQREQLARWRRWIARAGILPFTFLSLISVLIVVDGLWSGEIREITRYSKDTVLHSTKPIAYWFAVCYHSSLALFMVGIAVWCFRAAKLFGRSNARAGSNDE